MDDLLTIEDCAVLLSASQYQVRKYIKQEKLKAHKMGGNGHWRIWQKDLEEFVNGGNAQ